MTVLRPSSVGLLHYQPELTCRGYTLFCGGGAPLLIDMEGRVCHRWESDRGVQYASLLPSGTLLCREAPSEDVAGQRGLNGQSPRVFELDWNGGLVWEYRDDWLHHDHERLEDGNTLLLAWRRMTADQTALVRGGFHADDDPKEMLGDVILEVDPEGKLVREWCSWAHLDPEEDVVCPLDHRLEWTHCNSISATPDGRWLLSLRRTDTIAIVDPQTGAFAWKWGRGVLAHQHDARMLPNGKITLFDNGAHRRGPEFSRALEVDPADGSIAWSYHADPPFGFFTFMGGGTERLDNGNTLICESGVGRMFEVTRAGAIVWEYVNPFFVHNPRLGGRINIVFRAHRYSVDHPALRSRDLDPARFANLNRLYRG